MGLEVRAGFEQVATPSAVPSERGSVTKGIKTVGVYKGQHRTLYIMPESILCGINASHGPP